MTKEICEIELNLSELGFVVDTLRGICSLTDRINGHETARELGFPGRHKVAY